MRLVCRARIIRERSQARLITKKKKKEETATIGNGRNVRAGRLKITLRVRSFRRFDSFDQFFSDFQLFFSFFQSLFSNFSTTNVKKRHRNIMKTVSAFLDRPIKNHDSRLSLPPFVQHWWRRWVGARGFPWLVIQVNYDCTRKTHEEKENGRRSIFQRVFPRFSWVDITFRITCLEGMKSRALCALGALVGRFLVLIRWLITCFAYDYWIWF